MKKPLLLIPALILIAGIAGFLSLSGGSTGNILRSSDSGNPYPFSGIAEIEEIAKGRTHTFTIHSDGKKTVLTGNFNINEEKYPGTILYDGEKSYLFRPNPDQAVVYESPGQALYGFLPPTSLESERYEVTVLEKDKEGFPLKYRVSSKETREESIVTLKNIVRSPWSLQGVAFSLPEGTAYRNAEELIAVG